MADKTTKKPDGNKKVDVISGNVFDYFLDLADQNKVKLNTTSSYRWFIAKAKEFRKQLQRRNILQKDGAGKITAKIGIGKMYFFAYNPKHRDTLPYYDEFPLVIPIEYYKDGFLGLNLHYLPPRLRAILMGKLLEVSGNKTFNERTKMRVSYGILKALSA